MLKIIYSSPRPYWDNGHIETIESACYFDYPSPSNTVYYALFFYAYLIFMYSVRYTAKVNKVVVMGLYGILGLLIVTDLCV